MTIEVNYEMPSYYTFNLGTDEVIVGDPEAAEFHPILTLTRWNKEAALKVTFDDSKIISKTSKLEDNKVKFETSTLDIHYYTTSPRQFEHGGFCHEFILKQKPPVNTIKLLIELQNLKCYYQPPLTQELNPADYDLLTETEAWKDGKLIAYRPPNIVGSLAFYHSSKRGNKYKAGKAYHLVRPHLVDAVGNEGWGEYNRDPEKDGFLQITLPQTFLDTAVYPVIIGTPDVYHYYYTGYDSGEAWETTPEYMVDNVLTNYAVTNNPDEVEKLTEHNGESLADIDKVEVRAYGYTAGNEKIYLRPVFTAGDGDNHEWAMSTGAKWSPWFDITNDTNAPSPWTGSDLVNLDMDVQHVKVGGASNTYVSKVELRVCVNDPVFGKTDVGGTKSVIFNSYTYAIVDTLTEDGDATKVTVYANVDSGTATVHCAVYSTSVGHPDVNQGTTQNVTVDTTEQWWDATYSSPVSLSAADYGIAMKSNVSLNIWYDTVTGEGHYDSGDMPSPFVCEGHTGREYSIYVTYTTAPPAGQQLYTLINLMGY